MKKIDSIFLLFLAVWSLNAYDVIVFGDTHYDSEDIRDAKQIAKLSHNLKHELKRNMKRWNETMPVLLKNAADRSGYHPLIAWFMPQRTAFAVQLGDLIQGDCGNAELQKKSVGDA